MGMVMGRGRRGARRDGGGVQRRGTEVRVGAGLRDAHLVEQRREQQRRHHHRAAAHLRSTYRRRLQAPDVHVHVFLASRAGASL